MKSAFPKVIVIALVIASFAMLSFAAKADWKTYLMDSKNPDVFNEYIVHPNTSSLTLDYSYNNVSYWRQVSSAYEVNSLTSGGTNITGGWNPSQGSNFSIGFTDPNTVSSLSSNTTPPPLRVSGFVDMTTVPSSTPVSQPIVTGNGSGTNAPSGWSPTVVINGSGSTGTGTTGSGGIIVTGNGVGRK